MNNISHAAVFIVNIDAIDTYIIFASRKQISSREELITINNDNLILFDLILIL